MNDSTFASVLELNMTDSLAKMTDCPQIPDNYVFSPQFEQAMRLVFEDDSLEKHRRISIRNRIKLIFVIAAIFASGFLIGASRSELWSFVYNTGDSRVTFSANKNDKPQKTMGLAYTLTNVPQRFKLSFSDITPTSAMESYSDGSGGYILFSQQIVSSHEDYTVENAHTDYVTGENGIRFFVYTTDGGSAVKWYDGNYIFSVYSDLDKDALVKLCSSAKVKNAEK